jgi:hypothetical protein
MKLLAELQLLSCSIMQVLLEILKHTKSTVKQLCKQEPASMNASTINKTIASVKHKNISSSPWYVPLQEYLSHPSLVIYFFTTPPIKLKLGLQIGGRLLIANHLDHHCGWPIRNREQHSVHIYLHSSLPCAQFCCAFYQPRQTVQKFWVKTIVLRQTSMF